MARLVSILRSAALVVFGLLGSLTATQAVEPTALTVDVEGTPITAYLYRPPGAGPFPLLVLSHGSPRSAADRSEYGPRTLRAQAEAYADSGVAVAVPIRRGYGGSGVWAEGYGSCQDGDYYRAGLESARDLSAAIRAARKAPGVDPSRVALMGVSAGAWASVAAASRGGVMGVVSFAAGRGSRGPDDVCREDRLIDAMGEYGRSSPAPELWIYSENDRFFGPGLANRLYQAFVGSGGHAEFLRAPAYGSDGHGYIAAIGSWKPKVDAFLRRIGFLP